MKFLYHIPSLSTISAARTYLQGYKGAVLDLKHEFRTLTADDDMKQVFDSYQPDIFMTSLNPYNLKFLNLEVLAKQKKKGMRVFVNTPFWKSPMSKLRINETASLSENKSFIKLIRSGKYGDVYYNICQPDDVRMDGFAKATGYKHYTLLLAADKILAEKLVPFSKDFAAEVSFIGTFLPGRREFMKKFVFPLRKKYKMNLFCQDMTWADRSLNFLMKVGQYYNIPGLRSFKKNNVTFEQEQKILRSSTVCLNVHEDYQKEFGDFNDRTFKIPAYGGFEVTDNVPTIGKYLKDGEEIVIAKDGDDWFEKIEYFIRHPQKRLSIIEAGRRKVLEKHTYHNRVKELIDLYKSMR